MKDAVAGGFDQGLVGWQGQAIQSVDKEVISEEGHEGPHDERDEQMHVESVARTVELPITSPIIYLNSFL